MKTFVILGFAASLLAAQEERQEPGKKDGKTFEMPKPQKQHEWLKRLVGEWDAEVQMYMEEGKPPQTSKGTESGRMIGEFWALMENKGEFQGKQFTGIFTVGYDADAKKFVGSWIDNCSDYMWHYKGDVDSAGKILTFETEGPCPMEGGKIVKFRETIELKNPDHKVFTSMREKDGTWVKSVVINYRRRASE
jgi:hypothetical protein